MRNFKATLLIGFLVSLVLIALDRTGILARLDLALVHFLGLAELRVTSRVVQAIVAVTLAFGIAWTTVDIGRHSLKAVIAAGAFVEILIASWVLGLFGIFFSPFAGLLAIALSFGGAFAYTLTQGGRRKRVVDEMFGDRLSSRSALQLIDSNLPLKFEGEVCEATIVVCEVFNHEKLAQALSVPNYVAMHNAFLQNASEFLVERGGYLDECDGESLRVVFGVPLPDEDNAIKGCEAALALAERLEEVNRECLQIWKQTLDFRIGVSTGEIVVAAYGSRHLGSFSVSGEAVEFARRLCAANTIYGSRILIGSGSFAIAEPTIEVRPMELIQRHADDRSREEVYELLSKSGGLSEEEMERRDLFWKGIVYYREQRWDEALGLFYSARHANGSDAPVEFYIRRIEQLRQGVPSLDWKNARL